MLTGTYRLLEDAGYLTGEERIDRKKIAEDIVGVLAAEPVTSTNEAEIASKAKIVAEIRHALFSDRDYPEEIEKDLDGLVTQLVSGDGKVQDLLGDGLLEGKYVLCSKRVTRELQTMSGQTTMTLSRSGKFLSNEPDVIDRYWYAEAAARHVSTAQRLRKRLDTGEARQPALATRRQRIIEQAHEALQLELPRGGGENGS